MQLSLYTIKLLALAETLHRWIGVLSGLDRANRERVAEYADKIAATLARAGAALEALDRAPGDANARLAALRELGRISGYVETLVGVLQHHLDGRKIAGIKRRLETLGVRRLSEEVESEAVSTFRKRRYARLFAAEGYFRALADGLRA